MLTALKSEHTFTSMAYEHNNTGARRVGFHADEAALTQLEDIQHAVEVLRQAAEHCDAREIRSEAVYAALDYLSSIASRRAALLAFGTAWRSHYRQQRLEAIQAALRSIQRALAPRS